MLPPAAAPHDVVEKIAKIEAALDDVVNHGDDELFIASYLQGHFAVESRQLEMKESATIKQLDENMTTSLERAFANNELEKDDAKLVNALWSRLFNAL